MTAINYIAYVAFAVIFISVGFTIYIQYQQGEAERLFLTNAGELADIVNTVAAQDVGTSQIFSITVPGNSQLIFENDRVVAKIGGRLENFAVGTTLSGSTLDGGIFQLTVTRTQAGVDVSGAKL
jgi:hypothetical protein